MYQNLLQTEFSLKTDYQPGLIGKIIALHGQAYVEQFSFGQYFECKVGKELITFIENYNADCSQIWSLSKDNRILGSITIDGSQAQLKGAHLRWFNLDPESQGLGLGHLLLETAIQFCMNHHYSSIYLWTLKDLEPAGKLYRSKGFKLEKSIDGNQWGKAIKEECLRLSFQ